MSYKIGDRVLVISPILSRQAPGTVAAPDCWRGYRIVFDARAVAEELDFSERTASNFHPTAPIVAAGGYFKENELLPYLED